MGEELRDAPANQRRRNAGGLGLVGWHRRTSGSGLRYIFSVSGGVYVHPVASLRGKKGKKNHARLFISFSSEYLLTAEATEYSAKMTTTTTFQGISPNGKSSSRVLRPPGGESSFSLGAEENTTPQRKNKMASNIFAEPDDPHAHRRNNPPTGAPTGTLCGEPSAPLRRCQQPILFPKNPQPELTTIHNSGAALVWSQTKEPENGQQQANDDCPADAEQEDQQDKPQPSEPSEAANGATGGRRNPPGGKSSLILG